MRENEPIVALHLLTAGSVSLWRQGRPLGTLRPPQSLGFLGIMAQSDGTYDAVCEEETRTLEVAADALSDLLEDQFEFFQATLRYISDRLYYDMQELPGEALGSEAELEPNLPERPLDLVERICAVRRYEGFKRANLNALALLCQRFEEVHFEPGTVLWRAGEPATHVLLLVRGTIGCVSQRGVTFRYGPNTGVGGIDVLAEKPRWYSATTETKVTGLRGDSDRFADLLENDFSMASNFLASLASALVRLLVRKAELGHEPLAQRRDVSELGAVPVGA
jgi:CRP-like cAMP-binding protein